MIGTSSDTDVSSSLFGMIGNSTTLGTVLGDLKKIKDDITNYEFSSISDITTILGTPSES